MTKSNKKFGIFLVISITLGILIAWVDSRPNWDDTGITAMAILATTGIISYINPSKPLLWALTISAWIPFWGIINTQNYSSLLAIVFGLIGAYAGVFIRKIIAKD